VKRLILIKKNKYTSISTDRSRVDDEKAGEGNSSDNVLDVHVFDFF
jgi:hypothetical protein